MTIKCPLGNHVVSESSPEEIKQDRRKAWHQHGYLVVHVDNTRLSWDQREYVIQIGNMLNGKRKETK